MLRNKLVSSTSSTAMTPATTVVSSSTSSAFQCTRVLLAKRLRVSDVFKEAQRPIAAALRIHDHERRYAVIRSEVARFAVQRIHADGSIARSITAKKSSGLRLSPPEINAKMLAMLSCCRTAGDWKASFALTQSVKESFQVPLKEPWLQLCIGSIPAAQGLIRLQESGSIKAVNAYLDSLPTSEKLELREGFSHFAKLFGGLPANLLFTQSLPLFDETIRLASNNTNGTDHLVSLEEGGGGNALALSNSSENALLATQNGRMINSAHKVVNPSFVTYLKAQGLTKSDAETASLVAALTGSTSSFVTSLSRSDSGGGGGGNSSLVTTYHREVTFRINTHRSEWKAIRELLRHMQPFILPMNWYPDEVLWRVTLSDADAVAASLPNGGSNGGTTRITNNAGISNTTDAKQAATAISYVRHTLKALADSRLINYQSVASLLPALMLYPTVVKGMKRIAHAEHNKVMGRDSHSHSKTPTLKLLDLCAAPGGKTGQLMDLIKDVAGKNVSMSNQKGSSISLPDVMSKVLVIANDADERRLRFMRGRLQNVSSSMGFTHFSAEEFPIPKSDENNNLSSSVDPHQSHRQGGGDGGFDGVMVDVPCSGEGRLQRDTKGWSSWHPQQCMDFHTIQVKALRRAIAAARIGGVVVYSTCTLNPLENEAVVSTMLSEGLVDLIPIIHWGSNTNNNNNSVIEFGEGASSLLKGQIPSELRPFLEPGLRTWKIPMSNGQYYNPSSSHGRHHPHPHGIDPSMFPPPSPAVQQLLSDNCVRVVPHREWGSAGDAGLRRDERVLRGGVEAAYVGMSTEAFFLCKMVVKRHPATATHDGHNDPANPDRPNFRSSESRDDDHHHSATTSSASNAGFNNSSIGSHSRGGFYFANSSLYRPVREVPPGETITLYNNNQMFDLVQELSLRLLGNGSDAVVDAVNEISSKSLISRRDQATKVIDIYSASTPLVEFLNDGYSTTASLGPNTGGDELMEVDDSNYRRHRHTAPKHLNDSLRRQLLSFGQHLLSVRQSPSQLSLGKVAPTSSVSNVCLTQAGATYFCSLLGSSSSSPPSSSNSSNQVLDVPVEVVHRLVSAAGRRHMQHTDISIAGEFKAATGGGNAAANAASFSYMEVLGNKACTSGWGSDDQLQLKVEPTWARSKTSSSSQDNNDGHGGEEYIESSSSSSSNHLDGVALSLPPGSLLVSASSFTDPFWHMKNHGRSGRRGSTQEEREAERNVVAEADKRRHPVHSRWVKRLITDSTTLSSKKNNNPSHQHQHHQQLKEGPVILRSRLIPAHVKGSDAGVLSSGAEVILPGYVSLVRLSTNFTASKGPISNDSVIFAAVLTLTMSEEELQAMKTLLPRYASATTFGATLQLPPPGSGDTEGGSQQHYQVRGLLSGTPAALPSMFKLDGGGRGRDSFNYTPNTHNIDENTFLLRSSSPNSTASIGRSQSLPHQRHIERLASRSAQSEIETTTFTGDLIRQGNVGGVGGGREAANEFLEDGELGTATSRGVHGFGGSTITTGGFEGDGAAIEATETAATESGTNSGTGEYDMSRMHKPVLTVEAPTSGVVPQLEGSGDVIDGRYDQQLKRDYTSKLLDASQAAEVRDAASRMIPESDMASNHRSWAKLGSATSSQNAHRNISASHNQKHQQQQHHNLLKGTLPQSATQLVFGDDE